MEPAKAKAHVSRREILAISGMARTQRLLRLALQNPRTEHVFRAIVRRRHNIAMKGRFETWKARVQSLIDYHNRVVTVRDHNGQARTIQRVVRSYARERKSLGQLPKPQAAQDPNSAALLVQRVYRGYMGRGQALLLERAKLLRFLRSWSNNHTSILYHMTTLQEVEAQALIHTAIEFTCIPSKPIRNLPSLPQIQSYRAGLVALYWQVNFRRNAKRAERASERQQRGLMHYEDLYAKVREKRDKAVEQAILARQRELEQHLLRQEAELKKRQDYDSNLLILEMNNHRASALREVKEAQWRTTMTELQLQLEVEARQKAIQEREWELMKLEDSQVRLLALQTKDQLAAQQHINSEAEKVIAAKESYWREHRMLLRRGRPSLFDENHLLAKVRHVHAQLYQNWEDYMRVWPVTSSFRDNSCRISAEMREHLVQRHLAEILQKGKYSYRGVDQILAGLHGSKMSSREGHAQLLAFFDWSWPQVLPPMSSSSSSSSSGPSSTLHPWANLFASSQLLPALEAIEERVEIACQRVGSTTLQTVPLSLRGMISYEPNAVAQLEKVLQYKYLRDEHKQIHRTLSIHLQSFRLRHSHLQSLRRTMKEEKQLRSERRNMLQEAAEIEKQLMEIRYDLVSKALRLYDSIYVMMKLCVELFCVNAGGDRDSNSARDLLASQLAAFSLEDPSSTSSTYSLGAAENASSSASRPFPSSAATTSHSHAASSPSSTTASGARPAAASHGTKSRRGVRDRSTPKPPPKPPARATPAMQLYQAARPSGSPMLATKQRARGGRRLDPSERVFDPHTDDCELYWQQLVYLLTFVNNAGWTITALEMTGWPAPPKPAHSHTGARHIIKDIPQAAPSTTTSPPKKRLSMTARQLALIEYLKKKSDEKVIKPEMKFHDIPGLNVFIEDISMFDFLSWAEQIQHWAAERVAYMERKEHDWRRSKLTLAFLAVQRMEYLIDGSFSHANQRKSGYYFPPSASDCMKRMRSVASASAAEIFEVLLCTSHVSLEEGIEEGENGNGLCACLLRAEELDKVVGRHPISLLVRERMIEEIRANRTPAWPKVFPARSFLLQNHRNRLCSALSPAQVTPSLLLRVVEKETRETRDLICRLAALRILVLQPVILPGNANLPASNSTGGDPPFSSGFTTLALQGTVENMRALIPSLSTTTQWDFLFPSFMQPVFHCGRPAPKESFYKLLMREQALGTLGVYSRLDRRDGRINFYARRLVAHLQQRRLIYHQFVKLQTEYLLLDQQRRLMLYEDARSTLVECQTKRMLEEQRQRALERTWKFAFARVFGCGASSPRPVSKSSGAGHARVYAEDVGDERYRAALLAMRKYHPSLHSLPFSAPTSTSPSPALSYPMDAKASRFLRQALNVVSSNQYNFYCDAVQRLLNSIEAFRSLDVDSLTAQLVAVRDRHERDHSRLISWTTGERVYVNSAGQHVDPRAAIFPKLAHMSDRYALLSSSSLPDQASEGRKPDPSSFLARRGQPSSHSSLASSSSLDMRRGASKKIKGDRAEEGISPLGCEEVLVGGGLHSLFGIVRVLEDEQINSRGIALYEHLVVDQVGGYLPAEVLRGCQKPMAEFVPIHAERAAASPEEDDNHFLSVGLAMRSGFSCFPVCHVCKRRAASSISSRGEPLCANLECAHRCGSVAMTAIAPAEALRKQMAHWIVRKRYGDLHITQVHGIVRLQAIVRARRVRRKLRKAFVKLGLIR